MTLRFEKHKTRSCTQSHLQISFRIEASAALACPHVCLGELRSQLFVKSSRMIHVRTAASGTCGDGPSPVLSLETHAWFRLLHVRSDWATNGREDTMFCGDTCASNTAEKPRWSPHAAAVRSAKACQRSSGLARANAPRVCFPHKRAESAYWCFIHPCSMTSNSQPRLYALYGGRTPKRHLF